MEKERKSVAKADLVVTLSSEEGTSSLQARGEPKRNPQKSLVAGVLLPSPSHAESPASGKDPTRRAEL